MKPVHVECLPDEALVKKLGFPRKLVTHHSGKSRVFHALAEATNQLALVDEDPGSSKTNYEKSLQLVKELHGVKWYEDDHKNKVLVLKVKLEDWLLAACTKQNIKPGQYGLPDNASGLHGIINSRIESLGKLIDALIAKDNPNILTLREWLQ